MSLYEWIETDIRRLQFHLRLQERPVALSRAEQPRQLPPVSEDFGGDSRGGF
jgi:hypothetical protein